MKKNKINEYSKEKEYMIQSNFENNDEIIKKAYNMSIETTKAYVDCLNELSRQEMKKRCI